MTDPQPETSANVSNRKAFPCWSKNPQIASLRVELRNGTMFIFPYNHFAFAKLESQEGTERLQVGFSTHGIKITGTSLRELALAFQELSVEWMKELPTRYKAVVDSATIHSIEVEDLQETPE